MVNLDDELKKVLGKYYLLSQTNPRDNLLKYFIMDKAGFRQNPDWGIKIEFLNNFRGNTQTFAEFLKEIKQIPPSELLEYNKELASSLLQNYHDALEERLSAYSKAYCN